MDPVVAYPLGRIQRDTKIQTRAAIDMEHVGAITEAMAAGQEVPPVVLFGTSDQAWIGDGWHRITACDGMGAKTVCAILREGGRKEALKHALGANAAHGLKRTNADKRRCVELAIAEFGNLSSRQIAELCGVHVDTVLAIRPKALSETDNAPATRTTADGRQYPVARKASEAKTAVTAKTAGTEETAGSSDDQTMDIETLRGLAKAEAQGREAAEGAQNPWIKPDYRASWQKGYDAGHPAKQLPDFDAEDDGFPPPPANRPAPAAVEHRAADGQLVGVSFAKPEAGGTGPAIHGEYDLGMQDGDDQEALDNIFEEGMAAAANGESEKTNPYAQLKSSQKRIATWNVGHRHWTQVLDLAKRIVVMLESPALRRQVITSRLWGDVMDEVTFRLEDREEESNG